MPDNNEGQWLQTPALKPQPEEGAVHLIKIKFERKTDDVMIRRDESRVRGLIKANYSPP